MGRFFDGHEDHEGYVANESSIADVLLPERGYWHSWSGAENRGTFTGRHRAECSCGWSGLVTIADTDEWGDVSESDKDQIMLAWEAHLDSLRALVVRDP